MSRRELAKALKMRLADKFIRDERLGSVETARNSFFLNLKGLNDDNVIAGYLKCSVCGQNIMPIHQAVQLAEDCTTADEWIRRLAACERFVGGCRHDIAKPN